MPVKIEQPYPVFRDKIGLPLDGGLVYIGVSGLNPETNPIQCYFDKDFTLVAPQPLRTINGYISRNGSPANIFLKSAGCSITVKNKSKITQYTELNFQLSNFGALTASQILDESGLSQQEINNTVVRIKKSVADMLAINNPRDGQQVATLSYHDGQSKGGNTYQYVATRQLENDGGSVINGWVVKDKDILTVWDFGYKVGDAAQSTTAIQKAFSSKFPLKLEQETLTEHNWTETTNSINKVIIGSGVTSSIVDDLKFVFSGDVLIAKNFKINNQVGNLNYAIVVTAYDYVEIDGFDSENTYDSVSIWGARNEKSKAIVRNSNAIKAARVGFCADLGAKNVTFENLKSFDCRQGFHFEDTDDYTMTNCQSIRCGSGSPTPTTDQPLIYAGGFRFHKTKNGVVKHCKNITPAGTSNDWFGGGGSNFKAVGLEGVKFLTDDVANGDPEATFTYADMEFYDCKDFSFINQNFKSIFTGKMVLDHISGGDIELISSLNYLGKSNQITHAYLDNIKCGRIQIDTAAANAVLHMDAVDSATKYYNIIRGWAFFLIGDISYNWLTGDESQYPTLGFRFIGNNAKVFNLNSFTAAGRGGGSQISFESINIPTFKRGYIGNLTATSGAVDMFAGLNFDAYGIVSLGNLQYRPPSVTTAQLQSAPDGINSSNKYVGRDVFNTTTGKFMRATGAASTSNWITTDGSLTITPV